MLKIIKSIIGALAIFSIPFMVLASTFNSAQLSTTTATNGYFLQTNGSNNIWAASAAALSGGSTNTLTYWTSGTTVGATSSPTVGYLTATSTTATSTIAGGLTVGTDKLVVNNFNGNVGIGTTNPSDLLTVNGGNILLNGASASDAVLRINTLPNGTAKKSQLALCNGYGAGGSCYGYFEFDNAANTYSVYQAYSSGYLGLGAGGRKNDMAILATNGNVGIGTTVPLNKLDVNGGVAIGTYAGSAGVSNGLVVSGAVGIGYLSPGTAALAINGNVGIGTTGPLSKLDVAGGLALGSYAGVNAAPSNGLIVSGNVGIGTTTPASTLTVNGHIGTDGLAPALTSCGTSPSIVAGSTDTAGEVTEGSISTGCTITFKVAYTRAPFVTVTAQSGLVFTYTVSASAITITNVGALSITKLNYHVISTDL